MAEKKVSDIALRSDLSGFTGDAQSSQSGEVSDLRPELLGSFSAVKSKESRAAYKRGFRDGFDCGISFGRVEAYREQAGAQEEKRPSVSERGSKTSDP